MRTIKPLLFTTIPCKNDHLCSRTSKQVTLGFSKDIGKLRVFHDNSLVSNQEECQIAQVGYEHLLEFFPVVLAFPEYSYHLRGILFSEGESEVNGIGFGRAFQITCSISRNSGKSV